MIDGRAFTDEKKREVIEQLLAAWKNHPHMRFGQLLVNALRGAGEADTERRIFYIEDQALASFLERWEPR
jgi:hypothetical protein